MNKLPKIGNTIMIYFYGTILLILVVVFISFNVAVNNHLESSLESQLETAKGQVEAFTQLDQESHGMRRRSMFNQMMQENTKDSEVNILFLDSERQLTLSILSMMTGGDGGSTNGMGMHGNTDPSTTGYFMRLDPATYREVMTVYNYVKTAQIDLKSPAVISAAIGGENYYLKSIPFDQDKGQSEYVLAFIRTDLYRGFLENALRLLSWVLIPILILTFFIVRYLAKRLATPIAKLQALSSKLGDTDFEGEDFHLKEQELVDLNQSLNETAGKLRTYHENQRIFFQNVSHELRTPLTSIRGYAEGIRYGVFDKDNAAEVIMNESVKLEKLVDDILFLSRMESNESLLVERTTLKLSELLFEAREQVAGDAIINAKTIEVRAMEDPAISIYYEELLRGLVNLLSNAIRYAQSTIQLTGMVNGEDLIITVVDDGPGLEPGVEQTIFKRFSKGAQGLHGIGLSITKAAVERHGGLVTATNQEKHGVEFKINIPLKNLQARE